MLLLKLVIFSIIIFLFSLLSLNFLTLFKKDVNQEKKGFEPLAKISDFAIDKDGRIKKIRETSNLPDLLIQTEPLRGNEKVAGEEIKKTLLILNLCQKAKVDVSEVAVYNRERMDFLLRNGIMITADAVVDENYLVSSLQTMLSRFKIEGKIPQMIDYRFKKPIVRF